MDLLAATTAAAVLLLSDQDQIPQEAKNITVCRVGRSRCSQSRREEEGTSLAINQSC